jgi:hypothetical protein
MEADEAGGPGPRPSRARGQSAVGPFDERLFLYYEALELGLRGAAMGWRYRYEPTDRGGRVTIDTSNREARKAIHEFLRFQVRDHRTQD